MRLLLLLVLLAVAKTGRAQETDPAMALAAEREIAHQLAAQVADLSAQALLMSQKIAQLNAQLSKATPPPAAVANPATH